MKSLNPLIAAMVLTLALQNGTSAQTSSSAEPVTHTVVVHLKKPSFAQRHPQLHKVGRKVRRVCTVLLPVVNFAGGVAQVVTAVR